MAMSSRQETEGPRSWFRISNLEKIKAMHAMRRCDAFVWLENRGADDDRPSCRIAIDCEA